ncbi:MAG TPA: alpha/beta fold hydrolase [Vicinamibacterales bacterium]|nr:alpha/beta fold hydrolase [Vicinamibacterales bacterium]
MRPALTLAVVLAGISAHAQQPPAPADGPQIYTVLLQSRAIGQETVAISRQGEGWLVKGSNRLAAPLDVVTRNAEIHYSATWRPARMVIEGTSRGQEVVLRTTFVNGQASNQIIVAGMTTEKIDAVAADTVVLPNAFLGSYAVLARRLVGQKTGTVLRGYIAPQGEIPIRIDGQFAERIDTPRQAIAATRFALTVTNPPPVGDVPVNVWADANGALLRMSVPSQMLELAREDIASAATRTSAFSLPGDETVRIPASGFGLGATVTKPVAATTLLPAVILVGDAGAGDRDGLVAGTPVLGQIAGDLVHAGFLVVRYDKRGIGQSGGRAETSTLNDYAEDVRAVVTWLEKQRKDVDKKRIALVGYGEGAWIAMSVAARDKRVAALALVAAASSSGGDLVLEQQQRALARLTMGEADKQAKVTLQRQINAAAVKGSGWEGVPDDLRRSADTPWFQSFLRYDPARVIKDMRQPVLLVHGELDRQITIDHADRLADLARARKRQPSVDVVKVPSVNHLLVPARTGDVDEYPVLTEKKVSPVATSAIATWLARILG